MYAFLAYVSWGPEVLLSKGMEISKANLWSREVGLICSFWWPMSTTMPHLTVGGTWKQQMSDLLWWLLHVQIIFLSHCFLHANRSLCIRGQALEQHKHLDFLLKITPRACNASKDSSTNFSGLSSVKHWPISIISQSICWDFRSREERQAKKNPSWIYSSSRQLRNFQLPVSWADILGFLF